MTDQNPPEPDMPDEPLDAATPVQPMPSPQPDPAPPSDPPFVAAPPAAASSAGPRRRRGWAFRLLVWLLVLVLALPPAWVLVYRFVPPPVTPLMLIRLGQGRGMDYRWRPLSQISPALVQAAVAAEDARFCQHNGFDFAAMKKAMAHNQRRPSRVRGGSTISQQTAKNVFLWPDRSYLRKAVESWFTVLIETLWGKRRIMETYLNVVEMGPGIYGAEAAAHRYFGVDAAHLTNLEASRLAAIFPNPLKWKAVNPGSYVQGRSRKIGGAIGVVRDDGLAVCVGRLSGVVPAAPPDLSAPPPKAAQAFIQQQQAEQAQEEAPAPTSEAPPVSDLEPAAPPAAIEPPASPPASSAVAAPPQ